MPPPTDRRSGARRLRAGMPPACLQLVLQLLTATAGVRSGRGGTGLHAPAYGPTQRRTTAEGWYATSVPAVGSAVADRHRRCSVGPRRHWTTCPRLRTDAAAHDG